jgi:hypothetical protein
MCRLARILPQERKKVKTPDIKIHTDPQKYTQTLIKLHKRT